MHLFPYLLLIRSLSSGSNTLFSAAFRTTSIIVVKRFTKAEYVSSHNIFKTWKGNKIIVVHIAIQRRR